MDIHEFGKMGERAAAAYMEKLGYTVIGRNVHLGHSEFDLICRSGSELSFVEVKTRNMLPSEKSKFGPPRNAVNGDKQRFLLRGMKQFLREHGLIKNFSARIDVIEVYASSSPTFVVHDIKYHRNAVTVHSLI